MKLLVLSFAVLVAVAHSEIIGKSPFHQHVSGFADEFKKFMQSKPDGDFKDMFAMARQKYKDASAALSAMRPTGRPFRPHKQRSDYNHAVWELHRTWSKAASSMRNYMQAKIRQGRKDADETEILSSPFASHVSTFRQHFENFFANRPTGRPDIDALEKILDDKYDEAKDKLKARRPNGKSTKGYKAAKDDLKAHKDKFEDKLDDWEDELKEQDIMMSSTFGKHISGFKDHFNQQFNMRPTGRPQIRNFMEDLKQKYKEARNKLKGEKPADSASEKEKDMYDDAKDLLEDHFEDAEAKLKAWAKALNAHGRRDGDDDDETEIVSSPYTVHADTLRQHYDNLFANRPTGRPNFKQLYGDLKQKYKQAKDSLKTQRPGDKSEMKDYQIAYDQLKQHRKDIEDQLDQWHDEIRQKAYLNSPFSAHPEALRQHFDDLFANRPTGRPDFEQLHKDLSEKYKQAKDNLKVQKPKGKSDRKNYQKAYKQIKEHKDDINDQLDQWEDEVRQQEVLNSVFGQHITGFKNHFDEQFALRPTGRPQTNKFMDDLHSKFKQYKEQLKAIKPGKKADKSDKKLYKDAYDQLNDHWDEAEGKIKAWADQLKDQKDDDESERY